MAIVADLGSLQRLPAIIGAGHVAELALTGKDIERGAGQGDRLGERRGSRCRRRAQGGPAPWRAEIAANSPFAVQGTKAVLAANEGRDRSPRGSTTWPPGTPACWPPTTSTEAVTAFMEKRAPKFTGR